MCLCSLAAYPICFGKQNHLPPMCARANAVLQVRQRRVGVPAARRPVPVAAVPPDGPHLPPCDQRSDPLPAGASAAGQLATGAAGRRSCGSGCGTDRQSSAAARCRQCKQQRRSSIPRCAAAAATAAAAAGQCSARPGLAPASVARSGRQRQLRRFSGRGRLCRARGLCRSPAPQQRRQGRGGAAGAVDGEGAGRGADGGGAPPPAAGADKPTRLLGVYTQRAARAQVGRVGGG